MRNENGFTLIEALVALLILSVTLAGLIQGVSLAFRQLTVADERHEAMQFAQPDFLINEAKFARDTITQKVLLQLGDGSAAPIALEIDERKVTHKGSGRTILILRSIRAAEK